MELNRMTAPAAVLLTLALATPAALAQSGSGRARPRPSDRSARAVDSGGRIQDSGRGGAREGVAVPRSGARVSPPQGAGGGGQSGRLPTVPAYDARPTARGDVSRRETSRPETGWGGQTGRTPVGPGYDARQGARGDVSQRENNRPGAAWGGQGGQGGRPSDDGRYSAQRNYGRDSGQWRAEPRSYRPYGSYNRDVWRGRVRFGLGISIFAGRAFPFRFDYGWTPRFSYYYTMRPGLAYGGVSFLVDPDYAEVYIDGQFVGIARDFGGQPVPVAAGYHRIELYSPGFEPVAWDIDVMPGQVIPYRGSLYPVY